jgi:ABC-type lipoprotein release transport system permease subunit
MAIVVIMIVIMVVVVVVVVMIVVLAVLFFHPHLFARWRVGAGPHVAAMTYRPEEHGQESRFRRAHEFPIRSVYPRRHGETTQRRRKPAQGPISGATHPHWAKIPTSASLSARL